MIYFNLVLWFAVLLFMQGMCFICSFDPYPQVWKKLNAIEVATLAVFVAGVIGFGIAGLTGGFE